MSKKAGLILLGGAVATYAIVKLSSVADTAKAIQFKVLSINIKFPKIFLTVQIFNPTNNAITIDSIVGEVFFNNKAIGNVQYINKVPIQAQTYSTFTNVLVELTPAGMFALTSEIITRASKTGTFLVNGKIYVKGQGLPFTQTVKVF